MNFGDRSTGTGINQRNWSFGDGTWFNTSGTMPQIIHTYTAKGVYTVQLTVCNAAGCNTTVGQNITANAPPGSPVAKFAKNVGTGLAPLSVQFTDQSTGTGLNKWNWSFGDGTWFNTTVAAQKSPTHIYTAAGVYTAQLTVSNAAGSNTTIPGQTITVTAPVDGPVAKITKNVSSGTTPLTVNFGDRSTGTGINQRNWSFGDGTWFNTSGTMPQIIHTYTAKGVYTVQLTVCNAAGCNTTVGQNITANAPPGSPVAKFAKNVGTGLAPLSVQFTDQSTGTGLNKWNWSFGDGTWFNTTVAAQKSPTHIYTAAGVYTAQLTVSNAAGSNTTIPGRQSQSLLQLMDLLPRSQRMSAAVQPL